MEKLHHMAISPGETSPLLQYMTLFTKMFGCQGLEVTTEQITPPPPINYAMFASNFHIEVLCYTDSQCRTLNSIYVVMDEIAALIGC